MALSFLLIGRIVLSSRVKLVEEYGAVTTHDRQVNGGTNPGY
jgi:hypothetical protein